MAKSSAFGFNTPFYEQLEFFRQKLNLPTERWDDIKQSVHDRAFIVAGAMKADLLEDLNGAVDKRIDDGRGLEAFRKDFAAIVQKHGWHGWTGEGTDAGEAWRTKVIYQTNMATTYAAGRYKQLTDPAFLKVCPFWRYVHDDSVMYPRPMHALWGQQRLTLRYDHPFWKLHFPPQIPPNFGCHCRVTPVPAPSDGDAVEPPNGWKEVDSKFKPASLVDAGWNFAPGANRQRPLQDFIEQKLIRLHAPIGAAMWEVLAPVISREEIASEFAAWANAIRASGRTTGEFRVVDAIDSDLVSKMAERGVSPASAEIVVRDEDVWHAHRDSKVDSLPWDWYVNLPLNLADRRAVILDTSEAGKPALLYVFDLPGSATGKLVLKLDYVATVKGADGFKRKKLLNVLRSGKIIPDMTSLDQPAYDIIEGGM